MNDADDKAAGETRDASKCGSCGRDVGPGDKVCPACGQPVSARADDASDTYWETAPLESDQPEEHLPLRRRHRHLES